MRDNRERENFMMTTGFRGRSAVLIAFFMLCPFGFSAQSGEPPVRATVESISADADTVTIRLSAVAPYNGFLTIHPPRLVVELFDAKNEAKTGEIAGQGKYLKRVRMSQFQRSPRMVSRVVMDLNAMAGYRIKQSGNDLVVELVDEEAVPSSEEKTVVAKPRIALKAGKAPAAPKLEAMMSGRGDIMARLPKDLVTLDFDGTDLDDVIKLLAAKARINIIHGPDISALPPLTLHLADVPFQEAFRTILAMSGLVTTQVGDNILRLLTPAQLARERTSASTLTKVIPLNYSKATDLVAEINSVRTAEGRTGTASADSKTNAVIVTESLDGMMATERLIAQLDVRPKQVLIEAKLVEVGLNNSLSAGIQWSYYSADQGNAFGKQGTTLIGSPAGVTTANTISGLTGGIANQMTAGASSGYFPNGASASGQGTGVNLPASNIFGALTLGRITNNYILNMTLTAAATAGKVKVLSDPKIATLNNQPANINVITQYPYTTSNATSNGVVSQQVTYVPLGIQLTVTPTINADGRITLNINPNVSQPSATAPTSASTGAPGIDSRAAQTTVLVKDGETIVIGGLISDSTSNQDNKVPILGDIPILGWLFRSKTVAHTRSELLIFVTPQIMPD